MGDTQAAPPWFPFALVDTAPNPEDFETGLPSPWGRLRGWDYRAALSADWWNQGEEGRWGAWPEHVEKVEVIGESRNAVVLDLDGTWIAHLFPFPTGQDVSSLARYAPWASALEQAPLLLPASGLVRGNLDRVVVYPHHSTASSDEVAAHPFRIAQTLGKLHAPLVAHSTPNTERRWNDRLKSVEDRLKSTTLWRAPHTRHVVGLPNVHLSLEGIVMRDESMAFVPQPRSLVEHLICDDERLPGVAMAARLEQRLALMEAFSSADDRQRYYETWGASLPPGWTSPSSVSTVNGGVWIWRYEAILHLLAEARAYGISEQAKRCDGWLLDVSRIQARLGELRTVHAVRKGGVYAAIAAAIIGSGPLHVPFVVGALMCSVIAHGVYRRRTPPPF